MQKPCYTFDGIRAGEESTIKKRLDTLIVGIDNTITNALKVTKSIVIPDIPPARIIFHIAPIDGNTEYYLSNHVKHSVDPTFREDGSTFIVDDPVTREQYFFYEQARL
jgi:hypothetical protein